MTLHETTLRQLWKATNNSFALASESVIKGHPGLLGAGQSPALPEHR